jgi:hypothetical protein
MKANKTNLTAEAQRRREKGLISATPRPCGYFSSFSLTSL